MMNNDDLYIKKCVSSAVWAAYGDALGFPTELASPKMVQNRLGTPISDRLYPWKKSLERYGVEVFMPAGTYSDDTQLRLATCRAITNNFFDVESFAKIELPVWLSYALGAGIGSRKAASSLVSKKITWFSNFYPSYVNGGGNGAAMRIQPHVWAAKNLKQLNTYLPDVIRNAICTHGHMRGIIGAVMHAVTLAHVLAYGEIISPDSWGSLTRLVDDTVRLIKEDDILSSFWLPIWEQESKSDISSAAKKIKDEWISSITQAKILLKNAPKEAYINTVKELGGISKQEKGSGLKTALFALVAAWLFRDESISDAMVCIANLLESDTDSIATMAGALMGALKYEEFPNGKVQDEAYIKEMGQRMALISLNRTIDKFVYPDLAYWQLSNDIALNYVGNTDQGIALAGISTLNSISEFYTKNKNYGWEWYKTSYGQTIVCKRRKVLDNLPEKLRPKLQLLDGLKENRKSSINTDFKYQNNMFEDLDFKNSAPPDNNSQASGLSLEQMTNEVIHSGFRHELIGKYVMDLSEGDDCIEKAIAFVSIVVKARYARVRSKR